MCVLMEKPDADREDELALIQSLVLEAGRIMEDASPALALELPSDVAGRTRLLDMLVSTSKELEALARTAQLLNARTRNQKQPR